MMKWTFLVLFYPLMAVTGAQAGALDYQFRVYLDDKPIGEHRFDFEASGSDFSQYTLISEASYEVKILFVPVYQYQHRSEEIWTNGCVTALRSRTDDNGEDFRVEASHGEADELRVTVNGQLQVDAESCVRTYAYWNPRLLESEKLLNSQTGELETVSVQSLGVTSLPWDSQQLGDTLELNTENGVIRLWYGEGDRWLGLRSQLPNGRVLDYRTQNDREVVANSPRVYSTGREWML